MGSPEAPVYVESSVIKYVKNRRNTWPFSPCVHVVKRLSGVNTLDFRYSKFTTKDGRGNPGECDPDFYEYQDTEVSISYSINVTSGTASLGFDVTAPNYGEWGGGAHNLTLRSKMFVLSQEAFGEMYPKLDTGFSIPRFIAEMKDLKKAYSQLNLITRIREFRDKVDYFASHGTMPKKAFDHPLKFISSEFLGILFGVLPLIDDIKTIITRLRTTGETVRKFIDGQDKLQTMHFQKALSPLTFQSEAWFEETVSYTTLKSMGNGAHGIPTGSTMSELLCPVAVRTKRDVHAPSYHATMRYRYDLPNYSAFTLQFLGELDHWGINLSISDIWELVPFSFVVDWVFNLGQQLRKLDLTNLSVDVVVEDFCHSIKWQETKTVRFQPQWAEWTSTTPEHVSSETRDVYYRYAELPQPNDLQWPGWRLPSGFQLVIGTALLLQKRADWYDKEWK